MLAPCIAAQQVDAFPGAGGGGRYVTGGRGGKVIHVTNLNDSGTGSLRQALSTSGARIIVFDVSGTIELQSQLSIKYGDVTIAGQTAPGDGICLKNYSTYVGADNVIIRFIRFRMGDEKATENDAIWGRNQKNIILDHCSMSWSTDECSSFYNNENFTMQWCILGESLRNSVHGKGTHGYGGIWGGKCASFHHNLILHHDSRNPRMCGPRFRTDGNVAAELVDLRNCVFYNWGSNSGYAGEGGRYNFVNNYYKPGPATKHTARIFEPYAYKKGSEARYIPDGSIGLFYVNGNYMHGKGENHDFSGFDINKNSQTTFYQTLQDGTTAETTLMNESTLRTSTMFTEGSMSSIETQTAAEAYDDVLTYAGASLVRDAIDARYAREVRNGVYTYLGSNGSTNGLIDSQTDVGGYPTYESADKPADTDNDGMPDEWETAHGLNPNSDDSAGYNLDESYTNIEVYINSLVADVMNCTATTSTDETKGYDSLPGDDDDSEQTTDWNFQTLPTGWGVESTVLQTTSGNYDYNGMTIVASNTKSAISTDATAPASADGGATMGKYNTGGKGPGFSFASLSAGDVVTFWFTSNSDGSERSIVASDASGHSETFISSSVSTATTAKFTITASGAATFLSEASVNIWHVRLAKSTAIEETMADVNTLVVTPKGSIRASNAVAIEVYSLTGATVCSVRSDSAVADGLPRGIYLVRAIWNDGSSRTVKAVFR